MAYNSAQKVISILPFVRKAGVAFDDHATEAMGKAFDSVRQELHDKGQPAIVYEIIAKRIIEAAKRGERDPIQLQRAGLAALHPRFLLGHSTRVSRSQQLWGVPDKATDDSWLPSSHLGAKLAGVVTVNDPTKIDFEGAPSHAYNVRPKPISEAQRRDIAIRSRSRPMTGSQRRNDAGRGP